MLDVCQIVHVANKAHGPLPVGSKRISVNEPTMINRNTLSMAAICTAIFASATAAADPPSKPVLAKKAVVAPMPRTAANPAAVKSSADSAAALFARRDLVRLSELADTLLGKVDIASKQTASAKQKLEQAKAVQAAAAKAIADTNAALKQAMAKKTAADKALATVKQALDVANQKATETAKQAKDAAGNEAKTPSTPDAEAQKKQAQEVKQQADADNAAAQKAVAAAKQQFETSTAAAKAAAQQVTETTARTKKATAGKTAADKQVAVATAALKPLTAAEAAADVAAKPVVRKFIATVERLTLYEKAVPKADPKLVRLVETYKHTRPVLSCRISLDGENLFFGAQDNQLHRADLVTGATAELAGHRSWIRRFAFHPDGRRLLTGAYEGQLIWWNAGDEKPTPLKNVDAHKGFVRAVAVSPDGRFVATGGNDNMVRIWSSDDGKLVAELSGHARHVYNVAFHPNGTHLVSGDLMGVLKQWEVGTWKHVRDFDCSVLTKYDKTFKADCGGIRGLDFSPGGESLVVSGISGVTNAFAGVGIPTAVLFDWKTGKRLNVFKPAKNFRGACWGVRFHPSGDFIIGAGGGSGGAMWFWKPGQDKSFFDFKLPNVAYDVALHPDGLRVAAAFYDKTVRIYNLGPKTESEQQAAAAAAKKKKK